jgi:DNA-binding HxlR family transcriptional regulator
MASRSGWSTVRSRPKWNYRLTGLGMSLAEACSPLCEWGSEQRERIEP